MSVPAGPTPLSPSLAASSSRQAGARSPRLESSPILLHPLPPSSALQKESVAQSELELDRQVRQRQRERELAEALEEQAWAIELQSARAEAGTSRSTRTSAAKRPGMEGPTKSFSRPPQAYELYQAIDKKDIDFIMRVRDHSFGLLLQKNAGEFPILYAARIGEGHRDVVILLVGALSRYVNRLEDDDFEKKETRNTLKALRANLKIAIDNALLPGHNPHLLSSYLQVLIMSEGDVWVHKAVYDTSLLIRDPSAAPVTDAEKLVRKFCTRELRGVPGGVGDVEEYIANAALDLVFMGAWAVAAQQLGLDNLPTHTFARDTRTWTMLRDALGEHEAKLGKLPKRLQSVLSALLELGGDTKKSIRGRLRDVEAKLDPGTGHT